MEQKNARSQVYVYPCPEIPSGTAFRYGTNALQLLLDFPKSF
jgi:hypothetical protein